MKTIFVWRNDDHLWPNGMIAVHGDDIAEARRRANAETHPALRFPPEVLARINAEEPQPMKQAQRLPRRTESPHYDTDGMGHCFSDADGGL